MFRKLIASSLALGLSASSAFAQGATGTIVQPGEYIKSSIASGSAVTLTTTNTGYNLTSVNLSAGTWVCAGSIIFTAAGTTFPSAAAAFNTTSATLPTAPAGGYAQESISAGTGVGGIQVSASVQILTAPTTLYLVAVGQFTGTAPTMYGEARCWRLV